MLIIVMDVWLAMILLSPLATETNRKHGTLVNRSRLRYQYNFRPLTSIQPAIVSCLLHKSSLTLAADIEFFCTLSFSSFIGFVVV